MNTLFPNTPHQNLPKEEPIASNPFFPVIEPSVMRQDMRVDGTITPERLRFVLIEAIAQVNDELTKLRLSAIDKGITQLKAIKPDEQIDNQSVAEFRYKRAVYSYAKAKLVEYFNDFDATGKPPVDRQAAANNLQADAQDSISDIKGHRRSRVALI